MSVRSGGGVRAIVDPRPIGNGAFIAVVGPSGAGKDSVIDYARRQLAGEPRVHFIRRVVTRAGDASSEDHDSLSEMAFQQAEAAGAYALSWSSHGLRYGVPVGVDDLVRSGTIAIANLSRGVVIQAARRYENAAAIMITASAEALDQRLRGRGRESEGDIAQRLARNARYDTQDLNCEIIDNSGPLHQAGDAFVALIRSHLAARTI